MEKSKVCAKFAILAQLTMEQGLDYLSLVELAINNIKAKIKPEVDIEENTEILCLLAASVAFYHYSIMQSASEQGGDFKAGDVSISINSEKNVIKSKEFMQEIFAMANSLIVDTDFVFELTE